MIYVQVNLDVDVKGGADAGSCNQYLLLLRDFRSAEEAGEYLASALFTSDVVIAVKSLMPGDPAIPIHRAA